MQEKLNRKNLISRGRKVNCLEKKVKVERNNPNKGIS